MSIEAKTTSIRLSEDERELLDAYKAYLVFKTGVNVNRTGAMKMLMRRAKPPETEHGEAAVRYRRAYVRVFGETQPTTRGTP